MIDSDWSISLDSDNKSDSDESVLFIPDMALANRVESLVNRHGYDYPLKNLPADFFDASCIVLNMECCLTTEGAPWEPKPVLMAASPSMLGILPNIGVDVFANLANNHFLDLGPVGARSTIEALTSNGIQSFGVTGLNNRYFGATKQLSNTQLHFLAYSPVAHPLPTSGDEVNVSSKTDTEISKDIGKMVSTDGLVIVSFHQGVEFCEFTDAKSRKSAHQAVDAGAALVICHHTHVLQGIEKYKNALIFYGTGNFLIDIDVVSKPQTKYSVALRVYLKSGELHRVDIEPYKITDDLEVVPVVGKEKEALLRKLNFLSSLLSNRFGLGVNNTGVVLLWFKLHLSSLFSMVKREGLAAMFCYYRERVFKKLESWRH